MADEKTLKITTDFQSKGGQQTSREVQQLGKDYKQLSDVIRNVKQQLDSLLQSERQQVGNVSQRRQALKELTQQLNETARAQQNLNQSMGAPRFSGPVQGGFQGGNGGFGRGGIGGGAQVTSGTGGNYNGPVSPGGGGGFWGSVGKYGPMVGSVATLVGAGVGMVGSMMQQSGRHEAQDKLGGLENLARAQTYRNQQYREAISAPMGWVGIKRNYQFNVRTRDSAMSSVDENGRLVGSDSGAQRSETGTSIGGAAAKMSGESREIYGGMMKGVGGGIGALANIGLGALAMAKGAAAGAAVGSVIPGVGTAIGGVAGGIAGAVGGGGLVVSGIKDLVSAVGEVRSEARKMRTGGLEASQSEQAARSSHLVDELLAIRQHNVQTFEEMSGESVSLGRHSLGGAGAALSSGYGGYSAGEVGGTLGALRRTYGSRAGGMGQLSSILRAGNQGMSLGAATQIVGTGEAAGVGGERSLERIFAAGIKQGMGTLDMGFFEKLGGAFAESLYSPNSGARGAAAGAQLFNGLGTKPNANAINDRLRSFTTESDLAENPALAMRDLVDASNILGDKANGIDIGALAHADLSDLFGDSDKLRGLNITEDQRMAKKRALVNSRGDYLMADERVRAIVEESGGDFYDALNTVSSTGKDVDKETRKRREEQLNTIAAVGSETYGLPFAPFKSMLGRFGTSDDAVKGFLSGKASMPGVVDGLDAQTIDNSKKKRYEQAKSGKGEFSSKEQINNAIKILTEPGLALPPEDQKILDDLRSGNAKPTQVREVLNRANQQQGRAAMGAEGYGSTQQMLEAMGAFNDSAQRAATWMEKFADAMQSALPSIRRLQGNN